MGGIYNGTAHTFTFTTMHFTDFAFAEPTAGAFDLYLGSSSDATSSATFRPNAGWDGGYPARVNDWGFTGTQLQEIYVVPEVGAQFGSCALTIDWDDAVLRYKSVDFSGSVFNGVPTTLTRHRIERRCPLHGESRSSNGTITAGEYVAKMVLEVIKPGSSGLTVTRCSFESLPSATSIFVTAHDALHGAYLADVLAAVRSPETARSISKTFCLVDWRIGPASRLSDGMTNYKTKFDIGPTQDGYLFTWSVTDGKSISRISSSFP